MGSIVSSPSLPRLGGNLALYVVVDLSGSMDNYDTHCQALSKRLIEQRAADPPSVAATGCVKHMAQIVHSLQLDIALQLAGYSTYNENDGTLTARLRLSIVKFSCTADASLITGEISEIEAAIEQLRIAEAVGLTCPKTHSKLYSTRLTRTLGRTRLQQ